MLQAYPAHLLSKQISGHQVIHITSLSTVRAKLKSRKSPFCSQLIQGADVGIHVVHPVAIGRVLGGAPVLGQGNG